MNNKDKLDILVARLLVIIDEAQDMCFRIEEEIEKASQQEPVVHLTADPITTGHKFVTKDK